MNHLIIVDCWKGVSKTSNCVNYDSHRIINDPTTVALNGSVGSLMEMNKEWMKIWNQGKESFAKSESFNKEAGNAKDGIDFKRVWVYGKIR